MKVLILGGTRFLGKKLVEILLQNGHQVTVISRHPEKAPLGAKIIGAERMAGIDRVEKEKFEIIIDFIAFGGSDSRYILDKLKFNIYILISSTWVCRLGEHLEANQSISAYDITKLDKLSKITQRYLVGKLECENSVLERYRKSGDAVILRLPVLWGVGDHTGRMGFYCRRIRDGYPVIRVNGGNNTAPMVWIDDVVRAIKILIVTRKFNKYPIWEGLTVEQLKVKQILAALFIGLGKRIKIYDADSENLAKNLPDYLRIEPLWELNAQSVTKSNIFTNANLIATPQRQWLMQISRTRVTNNDINDGKLRIKELEFIGRR